MKINKKLNIDIPDDAVYYIIKNYLIERNVEGVPITLGISQEAAEKVINLFFQWAKEEGLLKEGILDLNSLEE